MKDVASNSRKGHERKEKAVHRSMNLLRWLQLQAASKTAAPAGLRRENIATPAVTAKSSTGCCDKKVKEGLGTDKNAEDHDDNADAMSESSRWAGETEGPMKMVWFQEVIDDIDDGLIEYLKHEAVQRRRKAWRHKEKLRKTKEGKLNPKSPRYSDRSDIESSLLFRDNEQSCERKKPSTSPDGRRIMGTQSIYLHVGKSEPRSKTVDGHWLRTRPDWEIQNNESR